MGTLVKFTGKMQPKQPDPEWDQTSSWDEHTRSLSRIISIQNANKALAHYTGSTDAVVDLLVDLMHICDDSGLDFDELLVLARNNYSNECN